MTNADDNFLPNPFCDLDKSSFPGKIEEAPPEPSDEELFHQALQNDELLSSAADEALFLQTMRKSVKPPEPKPQGFLCLGDLCKLPQKQKKTMKKAAAKKIEKLDDESDAFLLAMRNTTPLPQKGRLVAPKATPAPVPRAKEAAFADLLADTFVFSVSCSDEYLEGQVKGLDEAIMNRLRQGQLSPENHLDLHGLNVTQAFENLRAFIREAWFKGMRSVLIVTGRGKNSPAGQGVLRGKLQSWLTQEPFKRVVLAFCTAQPFDGGPGSIYVLLRKFRKKGPVRWERMPADADLY